MRIITNNRVKWSLKVCNIFMGHVLARGYYMSLVEDLGCDIVETHHVFHLAPMRVPLDETGIQPVKLALLNHLSI